MTTRLFGTILRAATHGMACYLVLLTAGCGHPPKSSPARSATSSLPETPGIFRDVAQDAGLRFSWGHGGKTPLNIIETLGHGCAFLDYNSDGKLDILLVGDRCALYRGDGRGRFQDVTAQAGLDVTGKLFGVAVGDYGNDGYSDLYVTGYGACALYRNRAGRSGPIFENVTATAGVGPRGTYDVASAAAFVDLDGDGKLDLFAGRYIVFTPQSEQLCDYNGVKASCGVAQYPADFPHVYRNQGSSRFVEATNAWGFGSAHGRCLGVAIRASEDGKGVTLYAANDELACDLFVPKGTKYENAGEVSGTAYARTGATQAGMGADWGDFDLDGRPDLVVGTYQTEPNSLYRGDGDGAYTEVGTRMGLASGTSPYIAWTARFLDYDNDGWPDLFFTNGHTQDTVHSVDPSRSYPQPLQLYRNESGRIFTDVSAQAGSAFQTPIVGRGAAFGDYDNDGRVDVLVVNDEGSPLLLHNESKNGMHWLGVRLVGKTCNRDGIGARVSVTADGRTYVRDQSLCGGYLSAHDSRLHFGLGTAARVEKVAVRWPNGQVSTLTNVQADSYITITEGRKL